MSSSNELIAWFVYSEPIYVVTFIVNHQMSIRVYAKCWKRFHLHLKLIKDLKKMGIKFIP